jgi:AcrR family transcriptional regulator
MNIPNARERILNAAVKIFAERSYEGSRIDEIAKEAQVPKSLIYYHFKSKEEILQVLIDNFIKEYMSLISENKEEDHQEKELQGRMKDIYYEFGMKNADLVRVILIDSLKKSNEKPVLFQIVEAMIAKEAENSKNTDINVHERMVAEFFTSFMPNYAYLCFADSWTEYFKINRKQFDQIYLEVYEETHGAYHKNYANPTFRQNTKNKNESNIE